MGLDTCPRPEDGRVHLGGCRLIWKRTLRLASCAYHRRSHAIHGRAGAHFFFELLQLHHASRATVLLHASLATVVAAGENYEGDEGDEGDKGESIPMHAAKVAESIGRRRSGLAARAVARILGEWLS